MESRHLPLYQARMAEIFNVQNGTSDSIGIDELWATRVVCVQVSGAFLIRQYVLLLEQLASDSKQSSSARQSKTRDQCA